MVPAGLRHSKPASRPRRHAWRHLCGSLDAASSSRSMPCHQPVTHPGPGTDWWVPDTLIQWSRSPVPYTQPPHPHRHPRPAPRPIRSMSSPQPPPPPWPPQSEPVGRVVDSRRLLGMRRCAETMRRRRCRRAALASRRRRALGRPFVRAQHTLTTLWPRRVMRLVGSGRGLPLGLPLPWPWP